MGERMRKDDLNDLLWFLAVAEDRSFTKAAVRLGIAQSTLSSTIKRLEERMGLRLLARTTRSVGTTEAGERLRVTIEPRLAEIQAEIASLMAYRERPVGTVKITLSDHAFDSVVWPKLRPVMSAYPDIRLELNVDNGFRNIVEDGFDAGIRLGESVEKDMIAVRIGPDWSLVAVAAPAYLAGRPRPSHPQDLIGHTCINIRHSASGSTYAWEFSKDGQDLKVKVDGQMTFNSSSRQLGATLAGYGVAYLPEDLAAPHIGSGELVLLLDEWSSRFPGYYIYYPSRRQNLPAFRVVIDALRHTIV